MTPEMRAKLTAFKAVRVKHPRLEEVDRAIRRSIHEHASYSQLLLYGPTGVGKSTVASRITERCLEEEPNRAIVPVVLVDAHTSDIGPYARLDYYRQVLSQLRDHAAVKDRLMHLALSAQRPGRQLRDAAEWLDMREAVEYALVRLQVKAVVIDEAQHLMRVEAPLKPVDQLDWLKSMTNRTNVLHILVGNYELYDFRNLNGQAARRGRDLHFPRYHLEEKTGCEEFVGALRYLLEAVPLMCDVDGLLLHWRWFAEWSIGCIGILRDWVVDTVAALCDEGGTTLTVEALKDYALQPDQRVRMEMEARTGEHKIEVGKATSHQQLQELLRITPSTSPKSTSTVRVGERAPQRDAVGLAVSQKSSAKCPGSGMLDLEVRSLTQSAIPHVECPQCGCVRKVSLKGTDVTFPPHEKLRTRTTHTGLRWSKREAGWRLSSPDRET